VRGGCPCRCCDQGTAAHRRPTREAQVRDSHLSTLHGLACGGDPVSFGAADPCHAATTFRAGGV
jgi:hypothetical protein